MTRAVRGQAHGMVGVRLGDRRWRYASSGC